MPSKKAPKRTKVQAKTNPMQTQKMNVEVLFPENYPNIYANNAQMVIGVNDIAIDFGYKQDIPEAKKSIIEMRTRIVLSPSHAKVFASKMQGLLVAYEKQFGTIPVEPQD